MCMMNCELKRKRGNFICNNELKNKIFAFFVQKIKDIEFCCIDVLVVNLRRETLKAIRLLVGFLGESISNF